MHGPSPPGLRALPSPWRRSGRQRSPAPRCSCCAGWHACSGSPAWSVVVSLDPSVLRPPLVPRTADFTETPGEKEELPGFTGALPAPSRRPCVPCVPAGQTVSVASMVTVDSADDPRVADYVWLTDVHLRRSLEVQHGLFIAEGEKVIRRALGAGYPVRSLLVTPERLAGLGDLVGSLAAPVYVVAPQVAEAL